MSIVLLLSGLYCTLNRVVVIRLILLLTGMRCRLMLCVVRNWLGWPTMGRMRWMRGEPLCICR